MTKYLTENKKITSSTSSFKATTLFTLLFSSLRLPVFKVDSPAAAATISDLEPNKPTQTSSKPYANDQALYELSPLVQMVAAIHELHCTNNEAPSGQPLTSNPATSQTHSTPSNQSHFNIQTPPLKKQTWAKWLKSKAAFLGQPIDSRPSNAAAQGNNKQSPNTQSQP